VAKYPDEIMPELKHMEIMGFFVAAKKNSIMIYYNKN